MSRYNFAALAALAACLLLAASLPARADEIQEINKLIKQGNQAQALERVNAYLAAKPKDAQARFLKGLILTEQNKAADAIKVFTQLSEDYPELPEPYNNLAVLYAGQGQYEKAKTALEMAIRTHPSYATAHENLGDIYAKMASHAYDKALQLDKSNTTAQTKLALIRELFSESPKGVKTSAAKTTVASTQVTSPTPSKPLTQAPAPPTTTVASAPPNSTPAKPVKSEIPAGTKTQDAPATGADEVIKIINAWAKAWSDKNPDKYLSFYAKDFKTPAGESRDVWENTRRERITKPKTIQVSILEPKINFTDSRSVTVSFKQAYRSDTLKTSTRKTLTLVKSGDKWLIQQEQVGS